MVLLAPRRRVVGRDGDRLREPLHARARAAAPRRRHRRRRQGRGREGRARALRRAGDGERPARLGGAGAGRARRAGHHRGPPRLPPRPRLRADRGEARRRWAPASAGRPHDRARPDRAPHGGHPQGAAARARPPPSSSGRSGVSPKRLLENTRKLAADAPEHGLRFISIRAADVASYVEHGAADVGVAGLDVLREEPRDLYEPLDLGIGRCRVIVGRPRRRPPPAPRRRPAGRHQVREPGRPPLRARRACRPRSSRCTARSRWPRRWGSPTLIVDITETGETLRANGLVIDETVLEVSARLVVNRVALKLHAERLRRLVEALRSVAGGLRDDPRALIRGSRFVVIIARSHPHPIAEPGPEGGPIRHGLPTLQRRDDGDRR